MKFKQKSSENNCLENGLSFHNSSFNDDILPCFNQIQHPPFYSKEKISITHFMIAFVSYIINAYSLQTRVYGALFKQIKTRINSSNPFVCILSKQTNRVHVKNRFVFTYKIHLIETHTQSVLILSFCIRLLSILLAIFEEGWESGDSMLNHSLEDPTH